MRTLIVALAIALISMAAHAQGGAGLGGVPEASGKDGTAAAAAAAKKKDRAEAERAYRKSLSTIPEASKPYDPWQNVRP